MRVLINSASANMGGAVTYLTNVVAELSEIGAGDEFVVVAPRETLTPFSGLAHVIPVEYPHPPRRSLRRFWLDQFGIRRMIRRHAADVLYSANGFGTFFSPCPQILLVRNAAYFSETFERGLRRNGISLRAIRLRRQWSRMSIRAADVVAFPTRTMRDRVARRTGLGNKPCAVLHYGFDRARLFKPGTAVPDISRRMQAWREEGYHVLLSVSAYAIHKNFETLIEALPLLPPEVKTKVVLTVERDRTGDKAAFDAMVERIERLGLQDTVVPSGHLPYEQLQHLYRQTDLFVFPSAVESFGHGMVEAMACGLPVVAAGTAVNREVLAEAGAYFDTFSPADCAAKIERLLRDDDARHRAAERSRDRGRRFTWRAHAEALLEMIHGLGQRRAHAEGPVSR